VAVVGRAITATALSTGCVTLFRPPGIMLSPLKTDFEMLNRLISPFNLIVGQKPESIACALDELRGFLMPRLEEQGLPMSGDFNQSRCLISNIGSPYSCSINPRYSENGRLDLSERKTVALLGFLGLRGFDPDLAASIFKSSVGRRGIRAYWTKIPEIRERYDVSPSEVAARSDHSPLEENIGRSMKELDEEFIGIPPIFGLSQYQKKMNHLERDTGKRIFEVVTPLSLPGHRLQTALEKVAAREGCRRLKGLTAIDIGFSGNHASSVTVRSRSREQRITFSKMILASGNLVSGGLVTDVDEPDQIVAPLQADISRLPSTISASDASLGSQALRSAMTTGIRTDADFHIVCRKGEVLDNVFGAGSALSGFSLPTGVGLGGVMFTAWIAAENAMEGG